jgi:hypothetical protein
MFRKTTLGIAAALIVLAPSVAFAGGGHGHGHHGHGHHGHGFHRYVGYSLYAGGGCYRYRWVETRFGLVRRLVNVCGYY